MNTRDVSKSMLLIAVTLLGSLVVAVNVRQAQATPTVGLVKGYGPGIGSAQPYEPVGPWVDGILVPQFLITQINEWNALKNGDIDLYDWPLRPSQILEFNNNICVPNPTGVTIAPCTTAGQAPIQTQIALYPVHDFGKFEIDMQNAAWPTGGPTGDAASAAAGKLFREAVAYSTDKEFFIKNVLNGLGAPNYTPVGCDALCDPVSGLWAVPSLNEVGLSCVSVAGNPMPWGCGNPNRFAIANAILDSAGLVRATTANCGTNALCLSIASTTAAFPGGPFRVDLAPGCATRTLPSGAVVNDCGAALQPIFYVRKDDPNREQLGFQLRDALQLQLGVDMDEHPSCLTAPCYSGDVQNFFDVTRRALFTAVFGLFNFNLYTGGWFLGPDPTYIDDLYDSKFIRAFNTNYPNYNNPTFDNLARALRAAQSFSAAKTQAYAAELEFNATIPIVDVWTSLAPLAYRIVHKDADPVLNGLKWEGIQNTVGVGTFGGSTWFNAHLIGAPLHDPAHQVFIKWGWKTDLLDSPNPIDSSFLWDAFANGLEYDSLNVKASDDPLFSGDLPWAGSVSAAPPTPIPAVGTPATCTFPNGETAAPDLPATSCSVLSYQLRPDLTFAASLDGKIPALPVTPNDIRFSILLAKASPGSFLIPSYIHVQDVVVTGPLTFDVYEKNSAIWDRHDIGFNPIVSVQHWCVESHSSALNPWPGESLSACLSGTWPTPAGATSGFPDLGVNTVSSTNGGFLPGPPVNVDLGSFAFVYDSQLSFQVGGLTSPNGPVLYRTRQTPGLALPSPYTAAAPSDSYFTTPYGGNSPTLPTSLHIGGWHKFHHAGNVNWYCTSCSAGIVSEMGPLPPPDMVINIVDLALIAVHFGETPGVGTQPYGHAPWDLSGPAGTPDGVVDIFDLTRVGLHFGQSFLGGTDIGGGVVGTLPTWMFETIPGT